MRYGFEILCVCALVIVPFAGCSDAQPECETAADCIDNNECTNDVCDSASKTCSNVPVEDDTACDFDGLPGVCVSGQCEDAMLCEGVTCEDTECRTNGMCDPNDGECEYALVENGIACSGGACLDGECTALNNVTGTVTLYVNLDGEGPPAADAKVEVLGTSLSTTTNELGEFSLDVFPGDWFFQASKEGTQGFIQLETVPSTGDPGLELAVAANAIGEQLEQELGITIDEAKGMLVVYFWGYSGLGGESAELNESYEHSSAEDADGNEKLSDALLPGNGADLMFFNVDLTEELTVEPKGAPGVNLCGLERPGTLYPVKAGYVTYVYAVCSR